MKINKTRKTIYVSLILFTFIALMYLLPQLNINNYQYFLQKRGIKILAVILVSFCISTSAFSFQTIANNKLITPSVMGLESLYLFIQTIVIFVWGSRQIAMMTSYTQYFMSLGLMVIGAWLLFYLLFKKDSHDIYRLVLIGMVTGGLFSGLSSFMQVLLDPNEFTILQGKMFASFNNINVPLLGISCLILIPCAYIYYKDSHSLNVLSLGRHTAINLGVNYAQLVKRQLMVSALMIAVSTALVGPITFLGILVVSLTRRILSTYHHDKLMIQGTILGSIFLLVAIYFVERIFSFNTTVGVIINFIGGVYFIYLMLKEKKR